MESILRTFLILIAVLVTAAVIGLAVVAAPDQCKGDPTGNDPEIADCGR